MVNAVCLWRIFSYELYTKKSQTYMIHRAESTSPGMVVLETNAYKEMRSRRFGCGAGGGGGYQMFFRGNRGGGRLNKD